ncbi:hypothetical protein ABIB57_000487 [Devosia sp. UYZn731]|uniref:hypothetical protein n=1 Tax=Devosia sp. UYZn731 TaxID=3156345 RepID=UPI003390E32A
MQGGRASLVIIAADMAPFLIGKDIFDHAVLLDTLYHKCIKLGPEGRPPLHWPAHGPIRFPLTWT